MGPFLSYGFGAKTPRLWHGTAPFLPYSSSSPDSAVVPAIAIEQPVRQPTRQGMKLWSMPLRVVTTARFARPDTLKSLLGCKICLEALGGL